jgi:hypothetical protein
MLSRPGGSPPRVRITGLKRVPDPTPHGELLPTGFGKLCDYQMIEWDVKNKSVDTLVAHTGFATFCGRKKALHN